MLLTVKTSAGETFGMDVEPSDTMAEVQAKLRSAGGISAAFVVSGVLQEPSPQTKNKPRPVLGDGGGSPRGQGASQTHRVWFSTRPHDLACAVAQNPSPSRTPLARALVAVPLPAGGTAPGLRRRPAGRSHRTCRLAVPATRLRNPPAASHRRTFVVCIVFALSVSSLCFETLVSPVSTQRKGAFESEIPRQDTPHAGHRARRRRQGNRRCHRPQQHEQGDDYHGDLYAKARCSNVCLVVVCSSCHGPIELHCVPRLLSRMLLVCSLPAEQAIFAAVMAVLQYIKGDISESALIAGAPPAAAVIRGFALSCQDRQHARICHSTP